MYFMREEVFFFAFKVFCLLAMLGLFHGEMEMRGVLKLSVFVDYSLRSDKR